MLDVEEELVSEFGEGGVGIRAEVSADGVHDGDPGHARHVT